MCHNLEHTNLKLNIHTEFSHITVRLVMEVMMRGKTLKVCVATWHHTPSVFKILCEFSIYYIVNSQVSHPNATYVQSSHKKSKLLLGNILQILKDKATMTAVLGQGGMELSRLWQLQLWSGNAIPVVYMRLQCGKEKWHLE